MNIMLKDVLKEMREREGLKQSDVAEYVGVTAQTYMKWENGKNEPKAGNLKKLAEILKVTEIELCRGERFGDHEDKLEFMQKVARIQNYLDDVTFSSILFDCIQDKTHFLARLEVALNKTQGFSSEKLDVLSDEEEMSAYYHKESINKENERR